MTEAAENETETKIEHWTYLGEMPGATVAKVAVWRNEDSEKKERVAYQNKPHVRGVVGMIYEIPIDAEGNARVGRKKWTGLEALDKSNLQLEADYFKRQFAQATTERQMKENKSVADLLQHAKGVSMKLSWQAREELIKQITRVVLSA